MHMTMICSKREFSRHIWQRNVYYKNDKRVTKGNSHNSTSIHVQDILQPCEEWNAYLWKQRGSRIATWRIQMNVTSNKASQPSYEVKICPYTPLTLECWRREQITDCKNTVAHYYTANVSQRNQMEPFKCTNTLYMHPQTNCLGEIEDVTHTHTHTHTPIHTHRHTDRQTDWQATN